MTAQHTSYSKLPYRSRSIDALSTSSRVDLLSVDPHTSYRPLHRRASDSIPAGRPHVPPQTLLLGFLPSPLPNGLSLDDIIQILADLWELIKDIMAAMCCCTRAGDDETALYDSGGRGDVAKIITVGHESVHDPAGATSHSTVETFYSARSSTRSRTMEPHL